MIGIDSKMAAATLSLPQQQQQQQQQLQQAALGQHMLVPVLQCFPEDFSPGFLRASSSAVERLAVSLMPEENFYLLRSDLAAKLQKMLEGGLTHHTAQIKTFGSSRNCFGSKSSDVDMCLLLTPKAGQNDDQSEPETAEDLIDQLVAMLETNGMKHVEDRRTARIPIVMFEEPNHGLECDICLQNVLAIHNTELLRTYAKADPRVRVMAYYIKHWAKRRDINSASSSTLSSYGYILLLINFLQLRNPPVLPNLQAIPPSWEREGSFEYAHLKSRIPNRPVLSADLKECNAYFFTPTTAEGAAKLQAFCARNEETVGSLLVSFFWYYAAQFDYTRHVVSVRTAGRVDKEDKIQAYAWRANRRLSIEDPFEVDYDVAHVLKEGTHRTIRKEFVRAYILLCQCGVGYHGDANNQQAVEALLDAVCEPAPVDTENLTPIKTDGDADKNAA